MKKAIFAIAAVAAIFAGCAKEIDVQVQDNLKKTITLQASVPELGTKVSADNEGTFKWQVGDKVTVLNTEGTPFEFRTEEGGTAVPLISDDFEGTLSAHAMYPASSDHALNHFYLNPTFAWVADASMMPMLGTVDTENLTATFAPVGGVLKLICYNVPAAARKLVVSSDSKKIVGGFEPAGSPKVITASASDTDKALTITFGDGHANNMVFYIPLPIGDLGKLSFVFKDDSDDAVSDEKTTKGSVELNRNKLVIAPALNCSPAETVWSEAFTGYDNGTAWSTPAAMIVDGDHTGAFGDADITYATSGSGTKLYTGTMSAGGPSGSPEMLINGSFTISEIPTNGKGSFTLTYYSNKGSGTLSLSSSEAKVSFGSVTNSGKKYTVPITISSPESVSKIDIVFSAGTNSRLDDIVLLGAGSDISGAPTISPLLNELSIALADGENNSASTSFTYSNNLDNLGVSALVVEPAAKEWLTASVTGSGPYTLTVSANKNTTGSVREGTVRLRATGVTKDITVSQPNASVLNPSVLVDNGNATFTATWSAVDNATGYVAYIGTTNGLEADPSALAPALEVTYDEGTSKYSVSKSGLTNGTTYYLYVKSTPAAYYVGADTFSKFTVSPSGAVKGSAENPYSVAEALDIISGYADNEGGESSVYTTGIVASVGSLSNGKLTYTISQDGTEVSTIKVYNGKGISNADFEATTDLSVGDQVVVYGQLYKYVKNTTTTPEINAGSYLTSLVKVHSIVIAPNTDILMDGNANSVYTLTVTSNYAWTASLNDAAATARGTNFVVLNSSDVVIDGAISGTAGTTTIIFKALGDGNADGETVTSYGTISFSDETVSSTKNIKQSPKGGTPDDVIDFSTQGLENSVQYTSFPLDNCTITFGDGGNDGKYYTSGSAIRIYTNGYVQVASAKTIKKIIFESGGSNNATSTNTSVNTGSISYDGATATWTGSATTVKMTSSTSHVRIRKITVQY